MKILLSIQCTYEKSGFVIGENIEIHSQTINQFKTI